MTVNISMSIRPMTRNFFGVRLSNKTRKRTLLENLKVKYLPIVAHKIKWMRVGHVAGMKNDRWTKIRTELIPEIAEK